MHETTREIWGNNYKKIQIFGTELERTKNHIFNENVVTAYFEGIDLKDIHLWYPAKPVPLSVSYLDGRMLS